MSSRWYYQMLMEEFGPVTVEQLRDLFEEGTLSNADRVRSETDDVWTTVAAVKRSLFADSGDRPVEAMEAMEAIGDLSELAFEFEDSGPTTRQRANPQKSSEDSRPVPVEPVPGLRMQSPTLIAAESVSSNSSSRGPVSQPPDSDQPAEEWFCQSFGQVLGPMSFDELIGMGESGALDVHDRVRCGERGLWKTVDCLPSVMRAVAVGRAIVVDAAVVPVTNQKSAGESASATQAHTTSVPFETIAEQPQQSTVHEPHSASLVEPAAAQPQTPETVPTKARGRNPRPKRRKNAKGEEELLDEIFDDVFSDDSPPARSNISAQTFAASPASTGSLMNTPAQTAPPTMSPQNPLTAASSATAAQESSRAAAARLTAAAMAAAAASRPSSKSSRSSFEVNPATIGILVAVMVVAAGGWYVWQNGIPFGSGSANGNGTFDTAGAVKALQAKVDLYKAMGDSPSESEWKDFSNATTKEMSALFNSVYAQAGATPNGAACLAATMCLMKIAKTQPDNKEFIDKNLAEFERKIVLVTK